MPTTVEAYNRTTDQNEACQVAHTATEGPRKFYRITDARGKTVTAVYHMNKDTAACRSKPCADAIGAHACVHAKAVHELRAGLGAY